MHFQNLLTFSIALLAGTSIAADNNGGEVPQMLRKGRAKLRASDLLGSSSASIGVTNPASISIPTPTNVAFPSSTPSASASAVKVSSLAIPSSSAFAASSLFPSSFPSSFQSSTRPSTPSSSLVHRPAVQGTHAVQQPAVTNPAGTGASGQPVGDSSLPVSAIAESQQDKDSHAPFWNKPITDTQGKPRPNAPDFSNAPDASISSKDGCSVRCNDLSSQCAELLPHNQDFCFDQFPTCQDLCVKEHVGSSA